MLQYKNVWGGGHDPMPSIRNDFEYAKLAPGPFGINSQREGICSPPPKIQVGCQRDDGSVHGHDPFFAHPEFDAHSLVGLVRRAEQSTKQSETQSQLLLFFSILGFQTLTIAICCDILPGLAERSTH